MFVDMLRDLVHPQALHVGRVPSGGREHLSSATGGVQPATFSLRVKFTHTHTHTYTHTHRYTHTHMHLSHSSFACTYT